MDDKSLKKAKNHLPWIGARFKEVRTITFLDGRQQEVVVFSSKSRVAQTTADRIIIVNELVLQNENLKDYVMVHESVHLKQFGQWFGKSWLGPATAIGLAALSYAFTLSGVVAFFVLVLVLLAWSWFLEFDASYQALKTLDMQTVQEARADRRALFQPCIFWRIVDAALHPPMCLTILIFRTLNRRT